MESLVTYRANCHCGAVRFTATLPDITADKVVRCNCSICTKNGYLLVYPKKEDVKFVAGEDRLGAYLFGNKRKPHRFCSACGTSILIDFSGSESERERGLMAVSIRTFEGIEDMWDKLTFVDFDGKRRLEPAYSVPTA